MRGLAGTSLTLISLPGLAIGGLWAFMKAGGAAAALLASVRRARPQLLVAGAALAVAGFAFGALGVFALRTGH